MATLLGAAALCMTVAACTNGAPQALRHTHSSSGSPARARIDPTANWVRAENARPGTSAWRLTGATTANGQQLTGYASAVSVAPGGSFGVYVESRLGQVTLTAYRLGWYDGAGAREVWRSTPLTPAKQPACTTNSLHMVSCSWRRTTTVRATGWLPGSYLLELTAHGKGHYIPITVRSPAFAHRLVLVSETTTYQAYNQWGGYSLYRGPGGSLGNRAYEVSYNRPYDGNGAVKLLAFEIGPIEQAEKLGLPLAYTTSWDVDQHPTALRDAVGVVSLGHDEYWTTRMRAAVTAARDSGSNLAFLGANAVYWRVRFADAGRMLIGYKNAALDPLKDSPSTTAQWRQDPDPDPENSLTGQLYECFPGNGPFVVTDPSFFLFRGTGVRAASSFPGLAGDEVDRAYPIAGTPKPLQIVAHSPQAMWAATAHLHRHDLLHSALRSRCGRHRIDVVDHRGPWHEREARHDTRVSDVRARRHGQPAACDGGRSDGPDTSGGRQPGNGARLREHRHRDRRAGGGELTVVVTRHVGAEPAG